jgi:multidrug efflux pump subunit AcrB
MRLEEFEDRERERMVDIAAGGYLFVPITMTVLIFAFTAIFGAVPRARYNAAGQVTDRATALGVATALLFALNSSFGISSVIAYALSLAPNRYWRERATAAAAFAVVTVPPLLIASQLLATGHLSWDGLVLSAIAVAIIFAVVAFITRATRIRRPPEGEPYEPPQT